MKTRIIVALLFVASSLCAQQTDSLLQAQSVRIAQLERSLQTQQQSINALKRDLRDCDKAVALRIDSIEAAQKSTLQSLSAADKALQNDIAALGEASKQDNQETASHLSLAIIIGAALLLVLAAIVFVLYHFTRKRTRTSIQKIHEAQQALQEESAKLDAELVDLLEKQFAALQGAPHKAEPEHALALKIADEIVRIETNLSRMDASIKGHKQLSASMRRIKDNFLANGYEIVDMLGKPYKEGIKAIVTTSVDETLPKGSSIITQIIKPQINYNGVMIQSAQIVVSQN